MHGSHRKVRGVFTCLRLHEGGKFEAVLFAALVWTAVFVHMHPEYPGNSHLVIIALIHEYVAEPYPVSS